MRATFFSPIKNFRIWGEDGKWNAKFELGAYTTEDEKIIEALRNHREYGRKIVEKGLPKRSSNVIQGARTAATQPVLDKEKKLLRLGELRAKLLKNDGDFRKDASEEDRKELQTIQGELGV